MSHPQGMPGRCCRAQSCTTVYSLIKIQTAQILLKYITSVCLTFFYLVSHVRILRIQGIYQYLLNLHHHQKAMMTLRVLCDLWSYSAQLSNEDLHNLHVWGPHAHKALLQYSSEIPRITGKKWDLGHLFACRL